ncbi:hypothetical protein MASR2M8_02570 [Opitutaceae bacterium]
MNRSTLLTLALLSACSLRAADHSGHGSSSTAKDSAESTAPGNYPLKTCVVSDEALGSMGKPFEIIHKEQGKPDRKVLLCCSMCEDDFLKDPAKHLAKLDAAEKAAAHHAGDAHKK